MADLTQSVLYALLAVEYLSSSNTIDYNPIKFKALTPGDRHRLFAEPPAPGTSFQLYVGVFRQSVIWDAIQQYMGERQEDFAGKAGKSSYALSFTLTENYLYIPDSLKFSTVPWAVGQLLNNGSFEAGAVQWLTQVLEDEAIDLFKQTNLTVYERCKQVLNAYYTRCGWQPAVVSGALDVYVQVIKSKNSPDDKETETSLLNSFYTTDIQRLLSSSAISAPLSAYLRQDYQPIRVDLKNKPDSLRRILNIANLPPGCWPSGYSLSLMQQAAVNLIFSKERTNQPVSSVNGPPGTGKTTLLKDVMAAVLVRRAAAMAQFENPANAFHETGKLIKTDRLSYKLYRADASLTNDGMLVASSNNTAVENITAELPARKSVEISGKSFSFSSRYFDKPAQRYFDELAKRDAAIPVSETTKPPVWGLITAVLGKQANRIAFADHAWQGYRKETETLFNALRQHSYTLQNWQHVCQVLRQKQAEWDKFVQERVEYEHFLNDPITVETLGQDIAALRNQHRQCQEQLQALTTRLGSLTNDLLVRAALKPGFWSRLFWPKRYRQYQAELEALFFQKKAIEDERGDCERQLFRLADQLARSRRYSALKKRFGNALPDALFWQKAFNDPYESQRTTPWADDALKQLQVELFAAAVDVHQVFVCLADKGIRNNISVLMHSFKRELQEDLSEDDLRHVWNALFLVVPVVSTTFASVASMLKRVPSETIGWLFVDEAGQAVPQAALGALNRSRRAVIIGDPLQLQPVVTVPPVIFRHLRKQFGVPDNSPFARLVSPEASVQSLADAVNPYGIAKVLSESETLWLGCPLRVHRRCTEPMFSVANEIAYDQYMLNATAAEPAKTGLKSGFLHITGQAMQAQWIPEQGQAVLELLQKVVQHNGEAGLADVFVISPFVAVVQEFRRLLKATQPTWAAKMSLNIGTVHTFQGKEADTVLFLCGCDASQNGAASWATSKPNLLNVALTRAKRAFVAVGDREVWQRKKYISTFINAGEVV